MKIRNIVSFIGLFFLAGLVELFYYYPAPTYNPFDNVFNVSRERLIKEGCIEDMIECGYVNVTKDFGDGTSMYYQFFANEPIVQAKGMVVKIDTLWIRNDDNFNEEEYINNYKKLFNNSKINFDTIQRKLKRFGVQLSSIQKGEYDFVIDVNAIYKPQKKAFKLDIIVDEGQRFLTFYYLKPKSEKIWQEYIDDLKLYLVDLFELHGNN